MTETFGFQYAQLADTAARVEFERAHGRRDEFAAVDGAVDRLVRAALAGERIINTTQPEVLGEHHQVRLVLPDEDGAVLTEWLTVAEQKKRGAWYLPEEAELSVGLVELARWMREEPRFALTAAAAEIAKASFESPDPVVIWATLEPIFEALYAPLRARRGYYIGTKRPEREASFWQDTIDPVYAALGVSVEALSLFRPGTGWSQLGAQDVIERRRALIDDWAQADQDAPARLRAWRVGELVARYYNKAKGGRALRRSVMNRQFERTLTAYFGGDWTYFLAFIGEELHPTEELTSAVAKPKLVGVGTSVRAAEVAAAHGLSPEQLQAMLGAFWQGADGNSPIELRAGALKRFWSELDLALSEHDDRPSLGSLLLEYPPILRGEERPPGDVDMRRLPDELRLRFLSAPLRSDIERLWGSTMLPRWPDRRVSEPKPYGALADTVGPAFKLWTELATGVSYGGHGLRNLGTPNGPFGRRLAELEELGCSIDPNIEGLASVELGLMNPENTRRLRDILTIHRRRWAETHLDRYIEARWRVDLTAAGNAFSRWAADKGKDPTPKQFAPDATAAANRWFGGDLTGVYRALGLKLPFESTADLVLPREQRAFMDRVYTVLDATVRVQNAAGADLPATERAMTLRGLARGSVLWVQLREALGHAPERRHYPAHFEQSATRLGLSVDEAWAVFGAAVERALTEMATSRAA